MLTREAVKDTGDATNAMKAANKIARDVGQAQVRAYLEVVTPYVEVMLRGYPKVGFWVRNYGNSPAHDFVAELTVTITAVEGRLDLPMVTTKPKNIPVSSEPTEIHSVSFRDGMSDEWRNTFLTSDEYVAVKLQIVARWKDVFDEGDDLDLSYSTVHKEWQVGQKYGCMLMSDFVTAVRNEISERGYEKNREDLDG